MKDAGSIRWHKSGQAVCPNCLSDDIIAVEYSYDSPEYYDGISEYKCLECGYREGRWTGKGLRLGYIEPRYGRGGEPVPIKEEE